MVLTRTRSSPPTAEKLTSAQCPLRRGSASTNARSAMECLCKAGFQRGMDAYAEGMAIVHRATITPTKSELIPDWAPSQPWGPPADVPLEVIGAFRFDDPDGRVGMETHLVKYGTTLLQIPLTYRDELLDGGDDA